MNAKQNLNVLDEILARNAKLCSAYINHDFVKLLESETLSREQFKFYLTQNYIFLLNYAKFLSYLIFKADNKNELDFAVKKQIELNSYTNFLVNDLKNFNIDVAKIKSTDESVANIAYSRYLSSVAQNGDFLDCLAALGACLIGYLEIGENIKNRLLTKIDNHAYKDWILANSSEELRAEIAEFKQIFNEKSKNISKAKFEKLNEIFATSTRLEINFWQHALDMKLDF